MCTNICIPNHEIFPSTVITLPLSSFHIRSACHCRATSDVGSGSISSWRPWDTGHTYILSPHCGTSCGPPGCRKEKRKKDNEIGRICLESRVCLSALARINYGMKCVHPVTSEHQGRPGHTLYIRVVLGTCGGVASLEVLGLSGHCRLLDYIRSYTSSSKKASFTRKWKVLKSSSWLKRRSDSPFPQSTTLWSHFQLLRWETKHLDH